MNSLSEFADFISVFVELENPFLEDFPVLRVYLIEFLILLLQLFVLLSQLLNDSLLLLHLLLKLLRLHLQILYLL